MFQISSIYVLLVICICCQFLTGQSRHSDTLSMSECPRGYYQKSTLLAVTRQSDCLLCPRGRYGSTHGLTTSACTAGCPLGKYNDELGAVSADDCKFCPPGTYGNFEGLSTSKCAALCPVGKFSRIYGATSSTACTTCYDQYNKWQCNESRRQPGGVPVDSFLN